MTQYKTLAELDVKPGDVVRWLSGDRSTHKIISASVIPKGEPYAGQVNANLSGYGEGFFDKEPFEIVSRATNPRTAVEQLNAKDDGPILWGDMTDAEKGALLLAHHEGKVIELWAFWMDDPRYIRTKKPVWGDGYSYRIKPAPAVETVKLYIAKGLGMRHIGTIDTIDGQPVSDSVKLEALT